MTRWDKRRAGALDTWTYENIFVHELIDSNNDLLGHVREDRGYGFTPYTNLSKGRAQFPTQSTLKDAKDMLLAHFVLKKLEDK